MSPSSRPHPREQTRTVTVNWGRAGHCQLQSTWFISGGIAQHAKRFSCQGHAKGIRRARETQLSTPSPLGADFGSEDESRPLFVPQAGRSICCETLGNRVRFQAISCVCEIIPALPAAKTGQAKQDRTRIWAGKGWDVVPGLCIEIRVSGRRVA
jgi:hypothetical protein